MVHNKAEVNATGGGRFKQLPLSALEETTANLMQFDTLLNAAGEIQRIESNLEVGTITSMSDSIQESGTPILNEAICLDDNIASSSNPVHLDFTTPKKKKKSIKNDNRMDLLEKYNEMQKKSSATYQLP